MTWLSSPKSILVCKVNNKTLTGHLHSSRCQPLHSASKDFRGRAQLQEGASRFPKGFQESRSEVSSKYEYVFYTSLNENYQPSRCIYIWYGKAHDWVSESQGHLVWIRHGQSFKSSWPWQEERRSHNNCWKKWCLKLDLKWAWIERSDSGHDKTDMNCVSSKAQYIFQP